MVEVLSIGIELAQFTIVGVVPADIIWPAWKSLYREVFMLWRTMRLRPELYLRLRFIAPENVSLELRFAGKSWSLHLESGATQCNHSSLDSLSMPR
jgi:hypothetical protein